MVDVYACAVDSNGSNRTPPPCLVRCIHCCVSCVGSSKCGTTSLAYYLQTHPMIMNVNQYAESKESHRFDPSVLDEFYSPSISLRFVQQFWAGRAAEEIFADQPGFVRQPSDRIEAGGRRVVSAERPLLMEYTPNYLVHDETPMLIHKTFPRTAHLLKFIVIVREPVKRMVSSWRFKTVKTDGGITSFKAAVESGLRQLECADACYSQYFYHPNSLGKGRDRRKDNENGKKHRLRSSFVQRLGADGRPTNFSLANLTEAYMREHCSMKVCRGQKDNSKNGFNGAHATMAHVAKGLYAYELVNWLKVFDLHQFLVISLEEFIESPARTLRKMLNFLQLRMFHNDDPDTTARPSDEDDKYERELKAMNKSYAEMARIFAQKQSPNHVKLKTMQQRHRRVGWDNETQLAEVLKVVLNQRPTNHSLDPQITPELLGRLKEAYRRPNKRLFEMLGWPADYY